MRATVEARQAISHVIKESFLNGKEGQLENLTGIFQVIYL
jgi:hypothetical protein